MHTYLISGKGISEALGMSRLAYSLLACFPLLGLPNVVGAQGSDIAGRYRIEGSNPTGSGVYRGEVAIARQGDSYQVRWLLEQGGQAGVGVVLDRVFAVTFQAGAGPAGIAAFRLNPDGSLTGIWAGPGMQAVGTERWIPMDRS
jgi:hypothetical protein